MALGVNVNFNPSQAQKIILMSMVVVLIAAFVERYSGNTTETATVPEIFIGAFIAAALLLLLSYFIPEFSVGLAVITMIAMVITKGKPFWDAINKLFPKPSNTPTPGSTTPSTNQGSTVNAGTTLKPANG